MVTQFLNVLISGIVIGALYALAAEGLNLIWGVMRIVNMAHGEFLMLGSYVAYYLFIAKHINPFVSLIIAGIVLLASGWITSRFLIRRILDGGEMIGLLFTFGLSIFLINMGILVFGGQFKTIAYLSGTLSWGPVFVSKPKLVAAIVSLLLSIAMYCFLRRTKPGAVIRAVASDREMAEQCGVDANRVFDIAFGLGAALAAMAGVLVSISFPFSPLIGQAFILKCFAVVVLGGLGNFLGALLAGILVGVGESLAAFYINVHMSHAVAFIIIIVTLLVRPSGLLGGRS